MLSAEGIGKNIEQAIENALFELKAVREDVDIKILNEGGLFKKAKVLVTISEDVKEKYEKKEVAKKVEEETKKVEKTEKEPIKEEKVESVEIKSKKENAVKREVSEKKKHEVKEMQVESEPVIQDDEESEAVEGMDPEEFLRGLFAAAGKEIEINITEDDKYRTYSVVGENLGDMIGHRGECYYAINKLLTAVTGKQEKRVLLDIGGYKEKRAETLTALAKRTADRVAKTGRYARLDPMNPSDRRIIHSALSEDERVVTLSKGEEPRRYVMVFPKDE